MLALSYDIFIFLSLGAFFSLFFHQAVQQYTQHGGPHVDEVDTPGTKAGGQDGHQGGGVQRFFAGDPEEGGADEAVQGHIQEGGGIAAHVEETGAGQRRAGEDLQQTGNHLLPVGHEEGSDQKAAAEKQEKDP